MMMAFARSTRWIRLLFAPLLACVLRGQAQTSNETDIISAWFKAQTNVHTWSADFVQIRTLKALTEPLSSTGHVWFAEPGRFRWEIMSPSKTIAVRQADKLWVVYPDLKRAELYSLDSKDAAQWRDMLAMLDAGFPRDRTEMEAHFRMLSQGAANGVQEIALEPKSPAARQMMPKIILGFDAKDFTLRSTEMVLGDGSSMKNVFSKSVLNPKIEPDVFKPPLQSDFKVVEPRMK
jgi:outer membrane lipoprotein-sorting protein